MSSTIKSVSYFLIVAAVLFIGCGKSALDKGLLQLRYFVVHDGNHNLGLADSAEAVSTWIDKEHFAEVSYIRRDSILTAGHLDESQLFATNRRYYPVRIGNRLTSTIVFDSTGDWQPVAFTDSFAIKPYFDSVIADSSYGSLGPRFKVVMVPGLADDLLLRQDSNGFALVPSLSLRKDMKPHIHSSVSDSLAFDSNSVRLKVPVFLRGARSYLFDTHPF